MKTINEESKNDMSEFVFVFTGIRLKDAEKVIESRGGKISNTVNSKTTHLVCKDKNSGSSKLVKAESLGINILSVEELEEMLNS